MKHRVLVTGFSNNRAGTEAVIHNYISHASDALSFDLLMYEEPTNFSDLFINGNNRFFVIPQKSRKYFAYRSAIVRHFNDHAQEYSAIWSNTCVFTNIDALRLGERYGIAHRVLHAHNSSQVGGLHDRVLSFYNRTNYHKYVTDNWACSDQAGRFFFGMSPYRLVPNAIDFCKYGFSGEKRFILRRHFGLRNDEFVIGTVGRLNIQKNHERLLHLFASLIAERKEAKLVIVGEGELRKHLTDLAAKLHIDDRVVFAGEHSDIQGCLSAFDVFVLPSLFEGLPMALIEAQINGLPCVVSSSVSDEASISNSCFYVDSDDSSTWRRAVLGACRDEARLDTARAARFEISKQALQMETWFGFASSQSSANELTER